MMRSTKFIAILATLLVGANAACRLCRRSVRKVSADKHREYVEMQKAGMKTIIWDKDSTHVASKHTITGREKEIPRNWSEAEDKILKLRQTSWEDILNCPVVTRKCKHCGKKLRWSTLKKDFLDCCDRRVKKEREIEIHRRKVEEFRKEQTKKPQILEPSVNVSEKAKQIIRDGQNKIKYAPSAPQIQDGIETVEHLAIYTDEKIPYIPTSMVSDRSEVVVNSMMKMKFDYNNYKKDEALIITKTVTKGKIAYGDQVVVRNQYGVEDTLYRGMLNPYVKGSDKSTEEAFIINDIDRAEAFTTDIDTEHKYCAIVKKIPRHPTFKKYLHDHGASVGAALPVLEAGAHYVVCVLPDGTKQMLPRTCLRNMSEGEFEKTQGVLSALLWKHQALSASGPATNTAAEQLKPVAKPVVEAKPTVTKKM